MLRRKKKIIKMFLERESEERKREKAAESDRVVHVKSPNLRTGHWSHIVFVEACVYL